MHDKNILNSSPYKTRYKFQIYPNTPQTKIIEASFLAYAYVYNHFLEIQNKRAEKGEAYLGHYAMATQTQTLKQQEGNEYLQMVDSQALTYATFSLYQQLETYQCRFAFGPPTPIETSPNPFYKAYVSNGPLTVTPLGISLPKLGKVDCFSLTSTFEDFLEMNKKTPKAYQIEREKFQYFLTLFVGFPKAKDKTPDLPAE